VEPNHIHLWERWSQTISTFRKGGAKPYPPFGKGCNEVRAKNGNEVIAKASPKDTTKIVSKL
jgi:hypothetical protein